MTRANATEMVKHNILRNYGFADFRDDPIDLLANDVAVTVDVQTASDAVRVIPIIELPASSNT